MCPSFFPATLVLTGVVSHLHNSRVTCEAGHKSVSADAVVPTCAVVGYRTYAAEPHRGALAVRLEGGDEQAAGRRSALSPSASRLPYGERFRFCAAGRQQQDRVDGESVSPRTRSTIAAHPGWDGLSCVCVSSSPKLKPSPQWIYEQVYCQLGDVEKLHQRVTRSGDRPYQWQAFRANQLRVRLTGRLTFSRL